MIRFLSRNKKDKCFHGIPANIPSTVDVCPANCDDVSLDISCQSRDYHETSNTNNQSNPSESHHPKKAMDQVVRSPLTSSSVGIWNLLPVSSTCDTENISNTKSSRFFFEDSSNVIINTADNLLKILAGVDDIDATGTSCSFEEEDENYPRSSERNKHGYHTLKDYSTFISTIKEGPRNSYLRRQNSLTKSKSLILNQKAILVDKPSLSSKKAITSKSSMTNKSNKRKKVIRNITLANLNTNNIPSSDNQRAKLAIVQKRGLKRGMTTKETNESLLDQIHYQNGNVIRLVNKK